MHESVQLDLLGQMHVDFDDRMFISVNAGCSLWRRRVKGRRVVMNVPIYYYDIQWIGGILRRQWWLLLPGVFFSIFGPIWASGYIGRWGPFMISLLPFVLFGLLPLLFFARGSYLLGIATADKIVVFSMERQRKKVARILGLLKQACTSTETTWQLEGTPFANPDTWDDRPATGKRFNHKRHLLISTVMGLWGLACLLKNSPTAGPLARVALLAALGIALLSGIRALYRKLRGRKQEMRASPVATQQTCGDAGSQGAEA